jgi:hypothetical protein
LARPLGEVTQACLLTDPDAQGASLVSLERSRWGKLTSHRASVAHR